VGGAGAAEGVLMRHRTSALTPQTRLANQRGAVFLLATYFGALMLFTYTGTSLYRTMTEVQAAQTSRDLAKLEDTLRFHFNRETDLKKAVVPMLVSTPQHCWVESRDDFAAAAVDVLMSVFNKTQDLIQCPDCDTFRLHVTDNMQVRINNGELALAEMATLRQNSRYANAKSLSSIKETPSGVQIRITSLTDGSILFAALVDSSQDLDDVKPWHNFSAELERRRRGESLYYVFINFGMYPNVLFQVEWLEQWGKYNQHISGLAWSFVNPIAAIGISYHYLFHFNQRFQSRLRILRIMK